MKGEKEKKIEDIGKKLKKLQKFYSEPIMAVLRVDKKKIFIKRAAPISIIHSKYVDDDDEGGRPPTKKELEKIKKSLDYLG